MSQEIKFDSQTKSQIQTKLTKLETTLDRNVNSLIGLYDSINQLSGNPEISNVLRKTNNTKENKSTAKNYVSEFKAKTDLNLEQLSALDDEIANKFGGW